MKPKLKLSNTDGSDRAVIQAAVTAAKQSGWSADRVNSFARRINNTASYEELIDRISEKFEVS